MKVTFSSDPVTRLVVRPPGESGGKRFCLVEPFVFKVDSAEITVPVGFWTDWASIPAPARAIFDPAGRWARAALAHDFVYFITYRNSRAYCDEILLAGMVADGVGWWARNTIYGAVRVGGWMAWDHYAKNNYHASVFLEKMPSAENGMQFAVTVAGWGRTADDVATA